MLKWNVENLDGQPIAAFNNKSDAELFIETATKKYEIDETYFRVLKESERTIQATYADGHSEYKSEIPYGDLSSIVKITIREASNEGVDPTYSFVADSDLLPGKNINLT